MDLGGWLRSLGLERYEAAFRQNEIDDTVLPTVTAEDLKDLGVDIVGHRRKLLAGLLRLSAAHEDDAERAVRAGLELIAAVSVLKTSPLLQTTAAGPIPRSGATACSAVVASSSILPRCAASRAAE